MASKDGKAMMLLTMAQGKTLEEAAQATAQQYSLKVMDSRRTTVDGNPCVVLLSEQVSQQQAQQGQQVQRSQAGSSNTQGGQGQSRNDGQTTGANQPRQKGRTGTTTNTQGQGQGRTNANDAPQQNPNAVRVLTYLIQYNGQIYAIHGLTYAALFNQYAPQFDRTAQSFKKLTDADKLNRLPERLRVKKVARTTTFAEAMTQLGMPAARLEELAILNGMEKSTTVQEGTLLKTINK
jgi:hypothetical protein